MGETVSNLDFVKCFLRPLEPRQTPQLLNLLSCYEQIRFLCRDSLIGPLENGHNFLDKTSQVPVIYLETLQRREYKSGMMFKYFQNKEESCK